MSKSLLKQPLFYTTVLSLLALGLIIASYVFGWTTPTQAPPNGNITLQTGASPAGSTGYIQFNAGSGALGGDANLFWDNTNKRLGIGTTTPSEKLTIVGGALKLGGDLKDSVDNIIFYDSVKKIASSSLPFDQGDITSDWASSSWTSGYYDVTNLTPANVKSGIAYGRGQTGSLIPWVWEGSMNETRTPKQICAAYGLQPVKDKISNVCILDASNSGSPLVSLWDCDTTVTTNVGWCKYNSYCYTLCY
jgi:hypothetical protein